MKSLNRLRKILPNFVDRSREKTVNFVYLSRETSIRNVCQLILEKFYKICQYGREKISSNLSSGREEILQTSLNDHEKISRISSNGCAKKNHELFSRTLKKMVNFFKLSQEIMTLANKWYKISQSSQLITRKNAKNSSLCHEKNLAKLVDQSRENIAKIVCRLWDLFNVSESKLLRKMVKPFAKHYIIIKSSIQ